MIVFSPLTIKLYPSLWIALLLLLPGCAIIVGIAHLNLETTWKTGLILLAGGHLAVTILWHGLLLLPASPSEIHTTLSKDDALHIRIVNRNGHQYPMELEGDSLITAHLIILAGLCRIPFGRYRIPFPRLVFLTHGSCSEEKFRRLRVLLRMAALPDQTVHHLVSTRSET